MQFNRIKAASETKNFFTSQEIFRESKKKFPTFCEI